MRSEPVVQVQALVKRYGTKTAVDGLDLVARAGVTAVLGPNGAGKTTTVETCEGYRKPDSGTVRVLGLDPVRQSRALNPRIGVMLQSGGVYSGARADEMLRHVARLHAHPLDVDALIERLGLGGCVNWCSWTSPPPASTRRPATPPGTSCGTCAPTASP